MLDRRDAPHAEIVGGANDVVPAVERLLVAGGVSANRPQAAPLFFIDGRNDWVELDDDLQHGISQVGVVWMASTVFSSSTFRRPSRASITRGTKRPEGIRSPLVRSRRG